MGPYILPNLRPSDKFYTRLPASWEHLVSLLGRGLPTVPCDFTGQRLCEGTPIYGGGYPKARCQTVMGKGGAYVGLCRQPVPRSGGWGDPSVLNCIT